MSAIIEAKETFATLKELSQLLNTGKRIKEKNNPSISKPIS